MSYREEMIEKAAQALSDACHEGRKVYEWDVAAEVVLDALLPQVTSVEDLTYEEAAACLLAAADDE